MHADSQRVLRLLFLGAVTNGFSELVRLLLEKTVDLGLVGIDYGSLLLAASRCGHPDLLQLVVDFDLKSKVSGNIHECLWPVPDDPSVSIWSFFYLDLRVFGKCLIDSL